MSLFRQPFPKAPRFFAGIWLALAVWLCWLGTLPNEYLIHVRQITTPQPYPFLAIAVELLVGACVLALFAWAARSHSWSRVWKALVATVLSGVLGLGLGAGSMHAPAHFAYFALFLIVLFLLAVLALLALMLTSLTSKG